MLEHIASIIGAIAWPSVLIFVAFIFRQEFRTLLEGLSQSRKNLRLKYGSFELETQFVEKIEQHLKKIADEPNADKRHELSSLKAALDFSLESVKPETKRVLSWLTENQLTNCTHVNWHQPPEGFKYDSIKELSQHGLVQVLPMYDGDVIKVHPVVRDFVLRKSNDKKA